LATSSSDDDALVTDEDPTAYIIIVCVGIWLQQQHQVSQASWKMMRIPSAIAATSCMICFVLSSGPSAGLLLNQVEEDDDVSVSSSIGEWDQQQTLLLHIIQASTLLSNLAANEGIAMSIDASFSMCQHEDLGDILLRTILGFL
jgi:hypothetical protein